MKIGGHETFAPRPGWLTKGMTMLAEEGVVFQEPPTADRLGVGRNMAKAIGWWLLAFGLAERPARTGPLALSELARAVLEHDPYLERIGSLWLLHATAMARGETALPWFFGTAPSRFSSSEMSDRLIANAAEVKGRAPTLRSAQREIAVIVSTYARVVPKAGADPEDTLRSPFRRLGLLRRAEEGRIARAAPVPMVPEALGLMIGALAPGEGPLAELSASGPLAARLSGHAGCEIETLLALAGAADDDWLRVEVLAGERMLRARRAGAAQWARRYFAREAAPIEAGRETLRNG